MPTGFFEQFMSPVLMGIPLIAVSLVAPMILFHKPSMRWIKSRQLILQSWALCEFNVEVLQPLKKAGHVWALLLSALMLFLISLNMLGLLPYTFTPTTQLSMNLGLAFPLWLATVIMGMRKQPTESLGHLLPEATPVPLIPVLIIIETISLFIRPLALGVRLTANLTAGHLLIHLISTAAYVLVSIMPAVALLVSTVLFLLTILEIAVAMIQAYVFVLLMSLYLRENI
nr:ATP synthase F0 subunit 6 [Upeneus nigromarginatus]